MTSSPDFDLGDACTHPNCSLHGKSPCDGIGCDGMDTQERDERRRITYNPGTAGHDTGRFDVDQRNAFRGDRVANEGVADLPRLASSPHWEDRVRAEVLRRRVEIKMPDQFPCIYETADSPHRAGLKNSGPYPWVLSPDLDMLTTLLPDYQALWDSYTAQWGLDRRRTFAVGLLDGLTPHGVFRPGTTPEQVIGSTMLIHTGMYRCAPERLRRMHPMYETWQASK